MGSPGAILVGTVNPPATAQSASLEAATTDDSAALLNGSGAHPLVIAHRGASADAPDNSLPAFEVAIEAGADFVELDVRRTADGLMVAHHSARRRGVPLGKLTYAELVQRSRYRPPALEEVLALCSGRVGVDLELKERGYEAEAVELLERSLSPPHAVVTSFHAGVIHEVKALRPRLPCGLVVGLSGMRASRAGIDRTVLEPARACRADFIVVHQLLTGLRPHARRRRLRESPLFAAAAEAGLPLVVWTVNGLPRLTHYIGDPRVAAVITDLPAAAIELRRLLGTSPTAPA